MSRPHSRRVFLGALSGSVAIAACSNSASLRGSSRALDRKPDAHDLKLPAGVDVPTRVLGRTGECVSLIGIGGYHLGIPDERVSHRIVHQAIDHGVNFFDNCWDYHEGESERRMGKALSGHRDKAFLMTKIDGRTKRAAAGQLEQSLRRLRTDRIDLVQIHEVIRIDDPARIFAEDGAIEALLEARQAGKIRFIGFTGHKDPSIHLVMLETAHRHGFVFDTVQMPINVMDPHYRSFEERVTPVLLERDIGILGMKPLGGGVILEAEVATPVECLHYAMSSPASVVITGCDSVGVLEQALFAAYSFVQLMPVDRRALLERTAPYGVDGRFEMFKTSDRFDATVRNPQWLDTAKI